MFTRADLKRRRKSWKAKTKYSGESTLVILPCNAGGPGGSYFRGNNEHNLWTNVSYYVREWRDDLVLAAVDNAVAWIPGRDDGLGAMEFEWEMSRCVSAWDAGIPTATRFDAAKIKLFVDSLRITCQRIKLYGFKRVFVILTPLAYRTSFMRAAELEDLHVILFSAARCGVANVATQLLRCILLSVHPGVSRSFLFTHPVLENVPLPKVYPKWDVKDSIQEIDRMNLGGLIEPVQGKCGKYYIWSHDRGLSDSVLSAQYLVPKEEDFSIFRS